MTILFQKQQVFIEKKFFLKCINERLSYMESYNEKKKSCAVEAGKNLV